MQTSADFFAKMTEGLTILSRISDIQYAYNPRDLVYQHDKVKLFHYHARKKSPHAIPVLVVFATVNRPEILDLLPDQSFIRGLLENGLDVYLLDWGYPDAKDKEITLSDYVTQYLHQAMTFIRAQTYHEKINVIGICQGGMLCLCHAALYPDIKNLVLISTPIDYQTKDNTIYHFVKNIQIDELVKLTGNIPGAWLTQFFISLRPFELIGKKYLRFVDHVSDASWTEKFLRVEKWLHDAPDQTGASFSEFIKYFYQQNKFIKGEVIMQGKHINLNHVTLPILNIMAKEDEIIPPSASRPLNQYVASSDYTQKIYPSGHIGIYVSDKVGKTMPKAIANWLKKR